MWAQLTLLSLVLKLMISISLIGRDQLGPWDSFVPVNF